MKKILIAIVMMTTSFAFAEEPLAIKQAESVNVVNVFPNPNKGNFFVSIALPEESSVEITEMNLIGSMVYNETIFAKDVVHLIDVNTLPSGEYIVRIKTANEVITKKINVIKD